MKTQSLQRIGIPPHKVFGTQPTPVNLGPALRTPVAEDRGIRAIDLALRQTPMNVPPVSLKEPFSHIKQQDIQLRAKRPSDHILIDENNSVYHLQPVIVAGAVRVGIKQGPIVAQRFMFKELAHGSSTVPRTPAGRKDNDTAQLRLFNEKLLRGEIETMLKVNSPLVPQIVLKTDDRYFLGMPPLNGNVVDVMMFLQF